MPAASILLIDETVQLIGTGPWKLIDRMIDGHLLFERNKGFLTLVKTVTKKVTAEAEAGNKEQALIELKRAEKVIAKVGGKGILHSRAASRKISSLTRLVNRTS